MDGEQLPLFQPVSKEEFEKAMLQEPPRKRKSRKIVTEPRTFLVWYALPLNNGFCTVPRHEEIQKMLNPEQLEYRDRYPVRQLFEIAEDMLICRDCFMKRGDDV